MSAAYDMARDMYLRRANDTLIGDIVKYGKHQNGYVWLSPTCIIIAADWRTADTWYVHLACGPKCLAEFFRLAPHARGHIAFARPGKGRRQITYHNYERMKRLCTLSFKG